MYFETRTFFFLQKTHVIFSVFFAFIDSFPTVRWLYFFKIGFIAEFARHFFVSKNTQYELMRVNIPQLRSFCSSLFILTNFKENNEKAKLTQLLKINNLRKVRFHPEYEQTGLLTA